MPTTALLLVLAAAVLHSTWNALTKRARHHLCFLWLAVTLASVLAAPLARGAEDLESLREQAIKAALKKIGPSVVTIETSGGTDIIVVGATGPGGGGGGARIRKGIGPTTGLIVSAVVL